jgi:hypothetical protein
LTVSEASATPTWPALTYETLPWQPSEPATGSRTALRRHRGPYQAAVAPEIARTTVLLPSETAAVIDEAGAEIARFDAELGHEIAPFAAVLLRSESAASSKIENLTASARAIAEAELHGHASRNATLIVANEFGAVPRPSPSRLMAGPLARFTESDDDATIESISRVRRLNALTYGHAGPVLHEVQATHSDGRIEVRPSPWLVLLAADTAQCCYRAVMSRWWGEAGLYPGPAEKWLSHVTETAARWEAVLDKLHELPDSWY